MQCGVVTLGTLLLPSLEPVYESEATEVQQLLQGLCGVNVSLKSVTLIYAHICASSLHEGL